MSIDLLVRLPDPEEIKKKYPASEKVKGIKAQRDKEIADVFTGKSNKFLLIIGPCSADKEEPVLDYISRLVPVQEQVKDKILIIPRIYTNKPRTTGEGSCFASMPLSPTVVRTITLSAIPSYTTPSGVRIFSLNSVISSFPFLRS